MYSVIYRPNGRRRRRRLRCRLRHRRHGHQVFPSPIIPFFIFLLDYYRMYSSLDYSTVCRLQYSI